WESGQSLAEDHKTRENWEDRGDRLRAHCLWGFLGGAGLRLSTGALAILAAEVLVLVMLVVTLTYVPFSTGINGHARNRIAGVGRSQLLLISWGLVGYLAFLVAVGSALSTPALAESTRVLVLERRHVLGGAAVTEEVYPGFKFTVCSYVCSLLRPQIIRDLDLPSHGFEVIPQESSFMPLPDGRYLFYRGDEEDTFQAVAKFSRRDAEAMPRFGRLMARMAKFIAPTLTMTPPDIGSLNPSELRKLFALNKQVQTLTEAELYTFA